MGIHGLFAQIGAGERISLAKLSSNHFARHDRPLRLAIDISIWLFQIQSGKGGSNPALRTFYYRLLRLLTLNIWPLFVFDGPNKPLFKRNKKVGGPGVRVANVPEFLAKQLLKQFGFPWHVAPGEAEAECALLQREGIVDAVLSEDVDTLMFGSGMTLRNWTAENSTKTPTHVTVYRAEQTEERSGLRPDGMVLVALMSGGDYLPEGIPGCGSKLACDAARAGFGRELCALSKRDLVAVQAWKDRLQHEIRTNESKFFSRRNTTLTIPEDFPNFEVLGYYTHPCVSTPEKLARLKKELKWDQGIDFPALRTFAADAFDWRCLGGAKKFMKNLAPAMLVRQLRLRGDNLVQRDPDAQEQREKEFVSAIHGKRNHSITDGELEYRISFIPAQLVPIDLSIEEEDDEFVPAGGLADETDAESEFMTLHSSTQDSEAPASPKKRNFKPFDPDQPEKLWLLKTFLQIGCPLLVEDYEANLKDAQELLKARQDAKAARAAKTKKSKDKNAKNPQENAMLAYARVTKPNADPMLASGLQDLTSSQTNSRSKSRPEISKDNGRASKAISTFRLPATQIPPELLDRPEFRSTQTSVTASRTLTALAPKQASSTQIQRTPQRNRKRPSPVPNSPAPSQKTITSFYSPSPRKARSSSNIIDLVCSSPAAPRPAISRPLTPTPPNLRFQFRRDSGRIDQLDNAVELPETITKRRRKEPLRRWQTEPVLGSNGLDDEEEEEAEDDDALLPIKLSFNPRPSSARNGDSASMEVHHDLDTTPKANRVPTKPSSTFATTHELATTTTIGFGAGGTNEFPLQPTTSRTTATKKTKSTKPIPPTTQAPRKPTAPIISATTSTQPLRRSPRQKITKKRIELRESLEGWWREVDAEAVDLSGDGSGWKKSGGKAQIVAASTSTSTAAARGWRKWGVEVLDLTGA